MRGHEFWLYAGGGLAASAAMVLLNSTWLSDATIGFGLTLAIIYALQTTAGSAVSILLGGASWWRVFLYGLGATITHELAIACHWLALAIELTILAKIVPSSWPFPIEEIAAWTGPPLYAAAYIGFLRPTWRFLAPRRIREHSESR